jgi:tetratricopeptide (TPR) repeat protein
MELFMTRSKIIMVPALILTFCVCAVVAYSPSPRADSEPPRKAPARQIDHFKRGVDAANSRRHDVAVEEFTLVIGQYAGKDPSAAANVYLWRGRSYMEIGKFENALADFSQAITLKPTSQAYVYRGRACTSLHKNDDALADFNQAIAMSPNDALPYRYRASAYLFAKDRAKAFADYQKVIDLDPKWGYYDRAQAYLSLDDRANALSDLQKMIENNPVEGRRCRANVYMSFEEFDKAFADFDKAIETDPKLPILYVDRAGAYVEIGDLGKALANCDKAIELAPDAAGWYLVRAGVQLWKGDKDKALADAAKAIELSPDASSYSARGGLYRSFGELDKAIQDAEKALELDSNNDAANVLCADLHFEKGLYKKAFADYDSLIQSHPKEAPMIAMRARAYYLRGDFRSAAKDFGAALDCATAKHPYRTAIWRYLAKRRAGIAGAKDEFAKYVSTHADESKSPQWPWQLVQMFLGRLTPDECLKLATSKNKMLALRQKCEACFYIGQYYLLEGNTKAAQASFQQAIDTKEYTSDVFFIARQSVKPGPTSQP